MAEYERLKEEMEEAKKMPYSKFYQPAENENFIDLEIEMEGFPTMMDGLLVNIINNCPNSNSCPFCHLNQKDFNKAGVDPGVKVDAYLDVGMSILHFGPNAMKGILKLASQLDFKNHRCEGDTNKKSRDERKARNNKLLHDRLGINVDYWFNVTGMTHSLTPITLKLIFELARYLGILTLKHTVG